MKFCERNDLIDRQSYVAQYVSLAFLTIGIMTILGSDDLLSAFCCGTAFAWDGFFNRQTEEAVFSSVIDLLFNVASFVYVGAWMPFDSFTNETLTLSVGRLIPAAILILLLKRLPIMIALYKFIPDVKTFREALFSGHFGPVGIGEFEPRVVHATDLTHSTNTFRGCVYLHFRNRISPQAFQPTRQSSRVPRIHDPTHRCFHRALQRCNTWAIYPLLFSRTSRTFCLLTNVVPSCVWSGLGHVHATHHTWRRRRYQSGS